MKFALLARGVALASLLAGCSTVLDPSDGGGAADSSSPRDGAVIDSALGDTVTADLAPPPLFGAPTIYPGDGPISIVAADLNGDGLLDLAAAVQSGSVLVLFGDGKGGFQAQPSLPCPLVPQAIAAADLDEDGAIDLVTANSGSRDVKVFLNQGDGTFAPLVGVAIGVENQPVALGIGDLNADGHRDLVVGSNLSTVNTLSVLLGVGDGSFQSAVTYSIGGSTYPAGVAVGNFDGTPGDDVATVDDGVSDTSRASVFLSAAGALQPPTDYLPVTQIQGFGIALGDLDEDGHTDILAANWGLVSVLRGDGKGGFQPGATSAAVPQAPWAVATADIDGDGHLDLIVTDPDDSQVVVQRGDGKGGLLAPLAFPVEPSYGVVAGDWNGDGRTDLATCGIGGVGVLLNQSR